MKKVILSVFLVSTNIFAAGFSGGDKYVAHLIEGRLNVTCPQDSTGGPTSGAAFCRSNILDPGEYTYFIGNKVDADTVKLQATREDGSLSVVKAVSYDGAQGKSKKSVNLWIRTVLQKPLLGLGKNTIHYVLTKNNSIVEEGTFDVTADDGGRKTCARVGFYYSQMSSDCMNPQNLCGRYFAENNYCK
jgi:hypothetical protein